MGKNGAPHICRFIIGPEPDGALKRDVCKNNLGELQADGIRRPWIKAKQSQRLGLDVSARSAPGRSNLFGETSRGVIETDFRALAGADPCKTFHGVEPCVPVQLLVHSRSPAINCFFSRSEDAVRNPARGRTEERR